MNFKISQLDSLPLQSERGHLYVLSNGEIHLGKSNGEYLQLAKANSEIEYVPTLPTDNIEQSKIYLVSELDSFKLYVHNGTEFIEASKKIDMSDVDGLIGLLDGLIATINGKADSTLITVLSNRIDSHELAQINSESGLHNIRLWDKKIQEKLEDGTWVDAITSIDLSTIEDELNTLIQAKLEGLETAPLEHTHEISHVTDLQTKLDEKVNQVDLDYTLENYYENIAQNILHLIERLDTHELAQMNSETGLHNIRVWQGKLEEFNSEISEWVEVVLSGAPIEHVHTTDEILGLSEFVYNLIAGLATGDIELTDASLIAKGIVQLSNETDSEDETKASTPLALKTAINDIKATFNQLVEDTTINSKTYTDTEITSVKAYVDGLLTHSLEDVKLHSDTNDVITLESAKDYTDTQVATNLDLAKGYTDTEISKLSTSSDDKFAPKVHAHAISDITNLQNTLDNKSPIVHKHDIEDVNDLQTTLDAKANLSNFNALKLAYDTHKHEMSDVNGLEDKLGTFITSNHTHPWTQITNRPTSTANSIDTAVNNSHLHVNKAVLDNLEDGNGILIYNGNPLGETAYLSVNDLAERDAIPMEARKEGLMVLVLENESSYYLKGGIDNAFWQIFATGSGGATTASTLPATPYGNLTGTNTQALIDELEIKKANLTDVYTKGEVENVINNKAVDYYTLDNLPDLSGLHNHDNKETLDKFSQFQGNLVWDNKTLGDLITDIYDADGDGVIDRAASLNGMTSTIEELNYLSGSTGNIQSQINAISSGVTFKGEFSTYQEMSTTITSPSKGDLVYIKTDENKGNAIDTQYCFDGTDWIYGGGTTKTPDATASTKGVIQLGGDLAHPSSTASAPKLTPTGVTEGLYRSANITIGEDGRITHAEEGTIVFLNDAISSPDEGWSSEKINSELSKYSLRNHTHAQLHNPNMLGTVELSEETSPNDKMSIVYNQITGKAEWQPQQGGKIFVGSKSLEGSYTLKAGSYITLLIDEVTKEITIGSTYRETGGNIIPTGLEIVHSIEVDAGKKVRFSTESGYNKVMLHTLQMTNTANVTSEVRLYNQAVDGYIEYNSNPEMFVSDIINIPIFDFDNSKMLHFEIENLGVETSTFTIRAKCTNLL